MNGPALAPLGTELLDDPAADPATVARSLTNIARANRWFGGTAAALWGIDQLLRELPAGQAVSLLDIGTGAADLPAAAMAAARGFPTVIGCAGRLPVRDAAVDVVLISQVAHHLAVESAVELFRAATALARVGVVVADLRRSEVAVAAFRVGSALLGFDAVTRADGITSVRRGYHARELAALAARAGQQAMVCHRPGFRVVALWRTR